MEKATSQPLVELLNVLRSDTPYVKNKWLNAVRKFTSAYTSSEPLKVGNAPPKIHVVSTQNKVIDASNNNTNLCKLNPITTRRIEEVPNGEHLNLPDEAQIMDTPTIKSTPDQVERDNILTTVDCSGSEKWTNSMKLKLGPTMIRQWEFDMIAFLVQPEPIYRMRQETFAWEPGSRG